VLLAPCIKPGARRRVQLCKRDGRHRARERNATGVRRDQPTPGWHLCHDGTGVMRRRQGKVSGVWDEEVDGLRCRNHTDYTPKKGADIVKEVFRNSRARDAYQKPVQLAPRRK
jgi:hypothetical protein